MAQRPSFKRWHPYLGEWVIIAPATGVRPWNGAVVEQEPPRLPSFDPSCYLCPGVRRACGAANPDYTGVFVFENDYPTLSMDYEFEPGVPHGPSDEPARGVCRVISFTPRHDLTLAELDPAAFRGVLDAFRYQYRELSRIPEIRHVLVFENKGAVIGVSNPHPHGQLYATDFLPRIPATQYANALRHRNQTGGCVYCRVLEEELAHGARVVSENEHMVAFVPGFARHTFEVHIMPRRHVSSIDLLTGDEIHSLAAIYRELLIRYDNLFHLPFPNITLLRNAPCGPEYDTSVHHFHIEFCPPLRSRDKLKYMAGFETGTGTVINPSVPEESAEALRAVRTVHYAAGVTP